MPIIFLCIARAPRDAGRRRLTISAARAVMGDIRDSQAFNRPPPALYSITLSPTTKRCRLLPTRRELSTAILCSPAHARAGLFHTLFSITPVNLHILAPPRETQKCKARTILPGSSPFAMPRRIAFTPSRKRKRKKKPAPISRLISPVIGIFTGDASSRALRR